MGTYSNAVNLATNTSCLPCMAGFYCDVPGLTASDKPCKAGHYCGGGAKVRELAVNPSPDSSSLSFRSYLFQGFLFRVCSNYWDYIICPINVRLS